MTETDPSGSARNAPHAGVIWDLDGVLVDTGEFHFQSWSETLARHGIPYGPEAFRATFGRNNAGTLAFLLGYEPAPEMVAQISEEKERLFRDLARGRAQPLPGVLDWLERLRAEGIRQAIASSAPPENIEVLMDELGLRPYFAAIVSGADLPAKPHPDVFLQAARLIGAEPVHCIVIEDSVAGVEAAERAGMHCIAVTTTNPAEALSRASLVVETLDKLPEAALWNLLAAPNRV